MILKIWVDDGEVAEMDQLFFPSAKEISDSMLKHSTGIVVVIEVDDDEYDELKGEDWADVLCGHESAGALIAKMDYDAINVKRASF